MKYCKRRAVAFRGKRAKVHLQSFVAELDAGFVLAFAEHLLHFRMRDEFFERVGRAGAGDQKIQIADGFLAAAQAAGGGDLLDAIDASIDIR